MLAIAEAGGNFSSLEEAGEGHHLLGFGGLEGTCVSKPVNETNKHTSLKSLFSNYFTYFS